MVSAERAAVFGVKLGGKILGIMGKETQEVMGSETQVSIKSGKDCRSFYGKLTSLPRLTHHDTSSMGAEWHYA